MARSSLHMSKYHIFGKHMHLLRSFTVWQRIPYLSTPSLIIIEAVYNKHKKLG